MPQSKVFYENTVNPPNKLKLFLRKLNSSAPQCGIYISRQKKQLDACQGEQKPQQTLRTPVL